MAYGHAGGDGGGGSRPAQGGGEGHLSGYYREEFGKVARFYDIGVRTAFKWVGGEVMFRCGIVSEAAVKPGMSVLDVACGTGTLLELLAACAGSGGRAVGIDMSEQMLAVARRKAQAAASGRVNAAALQHKWCRKAGCGEHGIAPMEFIHANAEELPFEDETFDRITASLATHELNRPGRMNALREMHRLLKPDGRVVIADMRAPDTLVNRLGMRMVRLAETYTLEEMWRRNLYWELGRAGFGDRRRRITCKGFFEIIVASKSS